MRHAFDGKVNKDHDSDIDDKCFARRAHKFANSAYRNAKQDGFTIGHDQIDSLEADVASINSLDMPSYTATAEQGKRRC